MPISLSAQDTCAICSNGCGLEGQVRAWDLKQSPELPASSSSQPWLHTGSRGELSENTSASQTSSQTSYIRISRESSSDLCV